MGYWKIQVSVRYLQVLPGGLQDGSFFGKCVRISAVAGIYKKELECSSLLYIMS